MKQKVNSYNLFFVTLILIYSNTVLGQKEIRVIESNKLEQIKINDTIFQKFCGDVMIEYSNLKIKCDTIMIDEHKDYVTGWGSVSFFNDTLNCSSDSIKIYQELNQIMFYQNSELNKKKLSINGNKIKYDFEKEIIQYWGKGNVQNNDYNISSDELIYYVKDNRFIFSQNIKLLNDNITINTNNMTNTDSLINFSGPTKINYENTVIECQKGHLQHSTNMEIFDGLTISSDTTIIKANYLKRNNNKNYFKDNISIQINNNTYIYGNKLIQENDISTINSNSYVKLISDSDSTIIFGDTIIINDKNEYAEIKKNIILHGNELNGKCEQLTFNSNYTKIKMIDDPVLWVKEVQVTGDEIDLYCVNNQLDSIYIAKNPFIIAPEDSINCYHQIKGNSLEGNFVQNKIDCIKIKGNGVMKYFYDTNKLIGINNVNSGNINLIFNKNNLQEVKCSQDIESNYIEVKKEELDTYKREIIYLNGFNLRKK